MGKKKAEKSSLVCADCIHEWACMMQCGGHRMAQENATRCACYEDVKGSAAYLLGKLDAAVPQWISVKDRPPEDNDRIIVFRPNEAKVSAYRYSVMWGWALKTSVSHSGITHWMPLPAPPKGDADNG